MATKLAAACFAVDELEQRSNLFMLTYIGSFSLDFTGPACLHLGDRPSDRIRPSAANHHHGAFRQEHFGDGAPDSTGPAGYQTNLVF